jgi:hypothetical protein
MSSARAPGVSREAGREACPRGMVAEPMSRKGAGNRTRLTGRLVIFASEWHSERLKHLPGVLLSGSHGLFQALSPYRLPFLAFS